MRTLYYCSICDITLCDEHYGWHFKSCKGTPSKALAEEYNAEFCSACIGIFAPPESKTV